MPKPFYLSLTGRSCWSMAGSLLKATPVFSNAITTCRLACSGSCNATMPSAPRVSPRFELENLFHMNINLTGATRLHIIVGDPISQVKSPGGLTRAFADRGHDGILVPVQVGVEDLGDFLKSADRIKNLDS